MKISISFLLICFLCFLASGCGENSKTEDYLTVGETGKFDKTVNDFFLTSRFTDYEGNEFSFKPEGSNYVQVFYNGKPFPCGTGWSCKMDEKGNYIRDNNGNPILSEIYLMYQPKGTQKSIKCIVYDCTDEYKMRLKYDGRFFLGYRGDFGYVERPTTPQASNHAPITLRSYSDVLDYLSSHRFYSRSGGLLTFTNSGEARLDGQTISNNLEIVSLYPKNVTFYVHLPAGQRLRLELNVEDGIEPSIYEYKSGTYFILR